MIDFTTDWEKMRDYFQISKEEFLASYSYVSEAEYDATKKVVEKKDALDKDLYKKALANVLYYQAVNRTKAELQPVLFIDEEETDKWPIEKCRIQYVKDQLEFIDGGNLDDEINETWEKIND